MNIQEAYKLTDTDSKKSLAKYLDIGVSAIYQWDYENLPDSAVGRIHKRLKTKGSDKTKKRSS